MDPKQNAANTPNVSTLTFDAPLVDEDSALYGLLDAESSGSASDDTWNALFAAAERDQRTNELAQSFFRLSQGRKLRTYPAQCIGDFYFRAGAFTSQMMGDENVSRDYLEKALAAFPGHARAFERLDHSLANEGEWKRLGDMAWSAARNAPKDRAIELYRRAAECFHSLEQEPEKVEKALVEVLKAHPADIEARRMLEAAYTRQSKFRDVAKLLEQSLTLTPQLSDDDALLVRGRLLELYPGVLREPERALPHAERLLAIDPDNAEARAVAEALLGNRSFASRAALVLAEVSRSPGREEDLLRYLSVELEHTRGAKRKDLLKEIAVLKEEFAADPKGAADAYEAALMLEPSDAEIREKYKSLSFSLGTSLEAARALIRVAPSVKDPSVRARLAVDTGELLLHAGDAKRARATLASVLAMQGVDEATLLAAAQLLLEIARTESDIKLHLEMLERITQLEVDADTRNARTLELAELATQSHDPGRAAAAWKRLIHTAHREEALIALEPLLEQSNNYEELVVVLEERAKDGERDDAKGNERERAQVLLLKAAQVLAHKVRDEVRAKKLLAQCLERFGPDRDVLREYIPLLENAFEWEPLASAMAQDAELALGAEQASLFGALGLFHLHRTHAFDVAFTCFARALEIDTSEAQTRSKLESLLSSTEHRLRAAKLLEPVYRSDGASAPLIRVLEARGAAESDPGERLAAFSEAAELAEKMGLPRWVELTLSALREAAVGALNIDYWLAQTERAFAEVASSAERRAEILSKALLGVELSTSAHRRFAMQTARAFEAAEDLPSAIAWLRKILAVEPSDEVLSRIDALLGQSGNPRERAELYRDAITRADAAKKPELLRSLGRITFEELNDAKGALEIYRAAYDAEPSHPVSLTAIETILGKIEPKALLPFYAQHLARGSDGTERGLRIRAARFAIGIGEQVFAVQFATPILDAACTHEELEALDVVEAKSERPEFSKEYFGRLIERADSEAGAVQWRERRAVALAILGELTLAASDLRAAAIFYEQNGDLEKTRSLLRTVQKWQQDDLVIAREIAALSEQLEDHRAAADELEQILVKSKGDSLVNDALWLSKLYADKLALPKEALIAAGKAYVALPEAETVGVFETRIRAHHEPELSQQFVLQVLTADGAKEKLAAVRTDAARLLLAAGAEPSLVFETLRSALDSAGLTAEQLDTLSASFEEFLQWESLGAEARLEARRWFRERMLKSSAKEDYLANLVLFAREENADPEFALGLYNRVLLASKEHPEAMAESARLSLLVGKIDEAVVAFQRLREHAPAESDERVGFEVEIAALLLDHRNDAKGALALLETAAPKSPDHPAVQALLSRLASRPDTQRDAIDLLMKAADAAQMKGHVEAELGLLDLVLSNKANAGAIETAASDTAWRQTVHGRRIAQSFALGDLGRELRGNLAAAKEFPGELSYWDRSEELARALQDGSLVAAAYDEVIHTELSNDVLAGLGPRAVVFQEEWFDDGGEKIKLLLRIFSANPQDPWAFERLKLIYDAEERWSELFALYDRAIEVTEDTHARTTLIEDAAHVAKDFAKDAERAIQYFEALNLEKPGTRRVEAILERLYEKAPLHEKLARLYETQLVSLGADSGTGSSAALRIQIARIELENLGRPEAAMRFLDPVPVLESDARVTPLLEALVAAAAPTLLFVSEQSPQGEPVRYAAARKLSTRYEAALNFLDFARLREVELEAAVSPRERIAAHIELKTLYEQLREGAKEFRHASALVELAPEDETYRSSLRALSDRRGETSAFAALMQSLSEKQSDPELAANLVFASATALAAADEGQEACLWFKNLAQRTQVSATLRYEAAVSLASLTETSGGEDLLWALEHVAALEPHEPNKRAALERVAQVATESSEFARAIAAWETALESASDDTYILGELIGLYEKTERFENLVASLQKRALLLPSAAAREDLVRAATVLTEHLKRFADALRIWLKIEESFGATAHVKLAISVLHEHLGDFEAAVHALNESAALAEGSEQATIWGRTGQLAWNSLKDADKAFESLEMAVSVLPSEATSLSVLRAMLKDARVRARAMQILFEALARAKDHRAQVDLVETRLEMAETREAKVAVLLETAQLAETKLQLTSDAFEFTRRAFLLSPHLESLEQDLLRLAKSLGRTLEAISAIEDALRQGDVFKHGLEWSLRLHATAGSLVELENGEPRRALEHYLAITTLDPSKKKARLNSIRLAGVTADWNIIASILGGSAEKELVEQAEKAARASGKWSDLANAVRHVVTLDSTGLEVKGTLSACLGRWYRDHLELLSESESAFLTALSTFPDDDALLEELSHVQRESQSPGLAQTLITLSRIRKGAPALLLEAVKCAAPNQKETTLLLLEKASIDKFLQGDLTQESVLDAALSGLLELYTVPDPQAAVAAIQRFCELPFSATKLRPLRLMAAGIAELQLHDTDGAIALFRTLLAIDPDDQEVQERLAALFVRENSGAELVALRREQVARAVDMELRLTSYAKLSEALFRVDASAEGLGVLHEALIHRPRAERIVAVLEQRLRVGLLFDELVSLWTHQGELAELDGDADQSGKFYRQAAVLAESKLADIRRALDLAERATRQSPSVETIGELARLATSAGEHGVAAAQLDRLRGSIAPDARPSLVMQLASALLEIGDPKTAILRLEESTFERPEVLETRELLASLYRRADDVSRLAPLLADTSTQYTESPKVIAALREASTLFVERCQEPSKAVPLLERALELSPDDRPLMLMLADAMGQAGDTEGAKRILMGALESFGGRKPKEKALVHYYIARLHLTSNDRDAALAELDTATKIDPTNAACLLALATTAKLDGKLERAERAYRALLTVLRSTRKVEGEGAGVLISRSEVLLALAELAERQGDNERALEVRESAYEVALESDEEADALERILREQKKWGELSRSLTSRALKPDAKGPVLWAAASLLSEQLNELANAWPLIERALRSPGIAPPEAIEMALRVSAALAKETEVLSLLQDTVEEKLKLADRDGAADVLLRLTELSLSGNSVDARGDALGYATRARSLGLRSPRLLEILDELYDVPEKCTEQLAIVRERFKAEGDPLRRANLSLRIAALLAATASDSGMEEACDMLASADEFEDGRVHRTIRTLAHTHFHVQRLVELYETSSRRDVNQADLVDALVLVFGLDASAGSLAPLEEACELSRANSVGALGALLADLRSRASDWSSESRVWILKQSAALANESGDLEDAKRYGLEAARSEEGENRVSGLLSLASAALETKTFSDASELYEEVLESNPEEERAWRPLIEIYRERGRTERLAELLESVAGYDVGSDEVRAELLWERARVLELAARPHDVVELALTSVLEHNPLHLEATARLFALYEKNSQTEELISLCKRSAQLARDRGDVNAFGQMSLRLADTLEKMGKPEEARAVLSAALDDEPESPALLGRSLSLMSKDDEQSERIALMQRLLAALVAVQTPALAAETVALSKELEELLSASGDSSGALAALETGLQLSPGDAALRARAEVLYRETESWDKLAELFVSGATVKTEPGEKVEQLRKAAVLYAEMLRDTRRAAETLKLAHASKPGDHALLDDLVQALRSSGDLEAAEAELSQAIASETDPFRIAKLLVSRGGVRAKAGENASSLADYEEAVRLGGDDYKPQLTAFLDSSLEAALASNDVGQIREWRLRIGMVAAAGQNLERAEMLVRDMLSQDENDREALGLLAWCLGAAGRYEEAIATYEQLLQGAEPDELADLAVRYADSCERANVFSRAVPALERGRACSPTDGVVRDVLLRAYEQAGRVVDAAHVLTELSELSASPDEKFTFLSRAGMLLFDSGTAVQESIAPLEQAFALRKNDLDVVALLADAYTMTGRTRDAATLLTQTVEGQKGRRTRELGTLHHRLARVSQADGDRIGEVKSLTTALDMDPQNGIAASELASAALELGQWEAAGRALRAITMLKTESPMPKSIAYLRLGEIAAHQGDSKRAILSLKRAIDEDASLQAAHALLAQLQGR
jgi:golgin subfamily B member 1